MNAAELAKAALSLEGAPFRLHGRDRVTGLDCIGVLKTALEDVGLPAPLPIAYSVRCAAVPDFSEIVAACNFMAVCGKQVAGDVLLARVGPFQLHLLVAADAARVVHAHAGLGRVIVGSQPEEWKVVGHWRLHPDTQG